MNKIRLQHAKKMRERLLVSRQAIQVRLDTLPAETDLPGLIELARKLRSEYKAELTQTLSHLTHVERTIYELERSEPSKV